jgi:hypothetical protein
MPPVDEPMTDDDGFDSTLSFLIAEAVNRLSPGDREVRIDYCRRTGEHGVRMVVEDDGACRFVWGGKTLLLADENVLLYPDRPIGEVRFTAYSMPRDVSSLDDLS